MGREHIILVRIEVLAVLKLSGKSTSSQYTSMIWRLPLTPPLAVTQYT